MCTSLRLIRLLPVLVLILFFLPASGHVASLESEPPPAKALVEAAAHFAMQVLKPGGSFVAKVLGGGAEGALVAELKRRFASVKHAKPPASRKDSSETFLVATGFKGEAGAPSADD